MENVGGGGGQVFRGIEYLSRGAAPHILTISQCLSVEFQNRPTLKKLSHEKKKILERMDQLSM